MNVSWLLTPSSVKLLKVPLPPLNDAVRAPPGPVTPNWVSASWVTLRPFRGRSWTCSRKMLVLSSALAVFSGDCAAVAETTTVSVTCPISTTKSTDVAAFTATRTSSTTVVVKPGTLASIL